MYNFKLEHYLVFWIVKLLRAYLDEGGFGLYHSVFITEFSKHVGPTKKIMFDSVSTLVFITQNSNKFELE